LGNIGVHRNGLVDSIDQWSGAWRHSRLASALAAAASELYATAALARLFCVFGLFVFLFSIHALLSVV
jgi:hypothetical protein